MTKRTRLFLLVAAGILLVGLGTGLIASYVGVQNLLIRTNNGPAEFAYVPADTHFVAYANIKDVMASGVRRKLAELQPRTGAGADQFKDYTGIDLEKDIDYLVASATDPGDKDAGSPPAPPLVLARGRFDAARIETVVRNQGGTTEDYKGKRLFVGGNSNKLAVSFLEPGLAAVGTPQLVRQAIDTKAGRVNATSNDELMRLVRDVDNADAWAVARFDDVQKRLPAEVARQIPPISWLSASGFIDDGIRARLHVEARDEASAQSLQDVVRGFIALARLQGTQHPEVVDWLNTLQLTGEGKAVSLSFSVPPQVIDALGALRTTRPPSPQPNPAPRPEPNKTPTL